MEKTETIHVDLGDTTNLTWIEYKLEMFVAMIKERLSKIVAPKDVVSDFDKSIWFTSIVVLLGKILPANRFLFRIIEEENQFLIQLHDPAQLQQPQIIEVPYRKVFDWGMKSIDEFLKLNKEERNSIYDYWRQHRTHAEICKYFGRPSATMCKYLTSDSTETGRYKALEEYRSHSFANRVRGVVEALKLVGIYNVKICTISSFFGKNSISRIAKISQKYKDDFVLTDAAITDAIDFLSYQLIFLTSHYVKNPNNQNLWYFRPEHCKNTGRYGKGILDMCLPDPSASARDMRTYWHVEKFISAKKILEECIKNLNQMKGKEK